MSASEDVKTLFRRFGGDAENYQEIVRDQQAVSSLQKWSMLGQINLNQHQHITNTNQNWSKNHVGTTSVNIHNKIIENPAIPIYNEPVFIARAAVEATVTEVVVSKTEVKEVSAVLDTVKNEKYNDSMSNTVKAVEDHMESVTEILDQHQHNPSTTEHIKISTPPTELATPELTQKVHTLSGLFSRLSEAKKHSTEPSALRRKYSK